MRYIWPGFAVAVAFAAVADAAELPTLKPKPAEHTRTCTIDGAKGFLIPGSDTCVKFGGYISGGFQLGGSRPQAGGFDASRD
jgi:hypothetical protein